MLKRNNTLIEIEKALPGIQSEKVEVLSEELERILSIKKLFQSDGGKELINMMRNNCSTSIRKAVIAAKASKEREAVIFLLEYSTAMDLLSSVQDISLEAELRAQLDEAVKEAYNTH